jgi:type II secretory pathway component PulJ
MVAVAILVVMAVITFSVLDSSIQVRDALAESDDTHRAARVAVDKLRRELQLAYLTPNVQAVNTYETVFVGSDDNPDRLWFASLSHQRLYRDSRECD